LGALEKMLDQYKEKFETNGLQKNRIAHKVLVVDDAEFIRRTFIKFLTEVGYNIVGEACNGQEAIDKYFELQPTLVTMDITMPIMEGIEAVEKIIEKDNTAKICMVSAMGYQQMVREAILKGAKNFVVKPVTEANLEKFLITLKRVAEA
jgi:two-component system chemotaxis response regulator CheY